MIKEAIVDSGVFIGSKYTKDQYNEESIKILEHFKDGKLKKIYITNYALAETVNFLLTKAGFQIANGTLDYLTGTDGIEIVKIEDLDKIKEIFKKYKNLSLTDCSLIALAEKLRIREIVSFDKHFDSVKGIIRLTSM